MFEYVMFFSAEQFLYIFLDLQKKRVRINQILAKVHNKFGKFIFQILSAAAKRSKLLQKRVPVTKFRNVHCLMNTHFVKGFL